MSVDLAEARKRLIYVVTLIEEFGSMVNIDLHGWSEAISENIIEYDEVLNELCLQEIKLAPEIRLPLMILKHALAFTTAKIAKSVI